MAPTNSQIKLLREVIAGKTVFTPASKSVDDMNAFQVQAEELIGLFDEGYLTDCRAHRESHTGKQQIDLVVVVGVTAKGRRLSQSPPLSTQIEINDDQGFRCPQCKISLRATAKFCDDCGYSLLANLESTLPMSSHSPLSTDSFVGLVLHGKYQVISEIGKGGMGHVYRAKHLGLLEDVAIKIIDKKFVSDANAVERFKREARAAAKLKHPNIVGIQDIDETLEPNRRSYIVMELVEGKTLKSVLQDEGKLTIDRAVALTTEICKAVAFAHRNGVIHRDIKPDNIMVIQRDGESGETIKVLDFGLAKTRESEDEPSLTHIGTVMGTPFYMSPEQCRGEELDARSDVYSLATVLYEMISGAPPFSGTSITAVCSKHQSEPMPIFDSSLNVPEDIVKVVEGGLAKNRDDRISNAQLFSEELQKAYLNFGQTQTKAALAETLQEQKSLAVEEVPLIAGLKKTDTLVLKISCELALKTGHPDIIETSTIVEALNPLGIAESEIWESLEILNERRYIKAHRVFGGDRPFQVYALELRGFHSYAKLFIPDYETIINRIIYEVGVNEIEDNFGIAVALHQPVLLVDFVLDLLENNGLLIQSKRFGGKSVISKVTVELKRSAREIGANMHTDA